MSPGLSPWLPSGRGRCPRGSLPLLPRPRVSGTARSIVASPLGFTRRSRGQSTPEPRSLIHGYLCASALHTSGYQLRMVKGLKASPHWLQVGFLQFLVDLSRLLHSDELRGGLDPPRPNSGSAGRRATQIPTRTCVYTSSVSHTHAHTSTPHLTHACTFFFLHTETHTHTHTQLRFSDADMCPSLLVFSVIRQSLSGMSLVVLNLDLLPMDHKPQDSQDTRKLTPTAVGDHVKKERLQ